MGSRNDFHGGHGGQNLNLMHQNSNNSQGSGHGFNNRGAFNQFPMQQNMGSMGMN